MQTEVAPLMGDTDETLVNPVAKCDACSCLDIFWNQLESYRVLAQLMGHHNRRHAACHFELSDAVVFRLECACVSHAVFIVLRT